MSLQPRRPRIQPWKFVRNSLGTRLRRTLCRDEISSRRKGKPGNETITTNRGGRYTVVAEMAVSETEWNTEDVSTIPLG